MCYHASIFPFLNFALSEKIISITPFQFYETETTVDSLGFVYTIYVLKHMLNMSLRTSSYTPTRMQCIAFIIQIAYN